MTKNIYIRIENKEYYSVPRKVGKAISVLLDACCDDEVDIVSGEILEDEDE